MQSLPFNFVDQLLSDCSFSEAVAQLVAGKSISVEAVVGSACALAAAAITTRSTRPVLLILPSQGELDNIYNDAELFLPGKCLPFPAMTQLPQRLLHPNMSEEDESASASVFTMADDLFGQRLCVLKTLLDQPNEPKLIVTSMTALLQPVPRPKILASSSQNLQIGEILDIDQFTQFLTQGGYHQTPAVALPGEFARRGAIIDLYAPDWTAPVRIELFGDEIESIRRFDITTQRSLEKIDRITLTRLLPEHSHGANLLDYLSKNTPVILWNLAELEHAGRTYLERLGHPETLPTVSDIMRKALEHPTATFSTLAEGQEDIHLQLSTGSVERLQGSVETISRELDLLESEQVFLFCPTQAEVDRLLELFASLTLLQSGRLHFILGHLTAGFRITTRPKNRVEQSVFIGSDEMFQRHDLRRPKRRQLGQIIDSFVDLKPGNYVVHVAHGIAVYRGIVTLTKSQQEEEHLHLEFADSQVLYVPISKIGLIQKYVAGTRHRPKLAKIGNQSWIRKKQAVQEAVFDLAEEMIEMQAKRETLPGIQFPPDSDWQIEFDAAFPFQETNDQLLAIEAVKQDMERSRPMDRLLCGDVGFGKTEVAIRAAFKAVDAGYQVAILVPTTILAEQHCRTFSERMSEFPVTVAALSRFQSKAEQQIIVEQLAVGKIDIIIGTHRVVSKDVQFHNLGLVVIDEEQRFGVTHKERLKALRDSVDVLTMTATPIPRTLHLSLLGIREISNLETAPEDRLAVETRVCRFQSTLIRDAILRELNRGGQIYFVHNRVHDIEELADRIQRIVPEVRIGIGHAQMPDGELERVMKAFINHEFDLLLSTTIIESGLDIPNANTIFIDEADRYGLADLHQLRGRVGRYKLQAYCYLLLAQTQMLNPQAAKRLRAIEEYSHLGSGFHLAMRDLEIRGAGNILGTMQSGHIATVGYEMYCQFLEAAVRTLKKLPPQKVVEVELDLPGQVLLPDHYIADHRIKIDFYRRISRIATLDQCNELTEELRDRFGPLPPEVRRLLVHARIKVFAHEYRIRIISLKPGISGDSGYIVLDYVSQPLLDQLKEKLASKGKEVRLTENRQAYIPMTNNLSPQSDPERILNTVLEIFEDSD